MCCHLLGNAAIVVGQTNLYITPNDTFDTCIIKIALKAHSSCFYNFLMYRLEKCFKQVVCCRHITLTRKTWEHDFR